MKDSEIVDLYFKRDELAIRATREKYGAYCYAIAWNILNVNEDVQECVNDTYYKAWTSIPPSKPDCLKAWLAKVVRNISINLWNKNHTSKRYGGLELLLSELEECIPSQVNVEKQLEEKELGKIISNWLRSLSKADRRIFLQRYFEGAKVGEIARREKTKAQNISKKLFLLRTKLKEVLEAEEVYL